MLLTDGKEEDDGIKKSARNKRQYDKINYWHEDEQLSNSNNQKIKTNPNQDKSSQKQSRGSKAAKRIDKDFFNSEDEEEKREKEDKMDEDSLYYFSKNIDLKRNHQIKDVQSQRPMPHRIQSTSKQLETKTEKAMRPHFLTAGKSIVNSMSISNASNRSSVSSRKTIQKENHSGRECNCNRQDSLDRKSYQSRKSNKNSQYTIEEIHYLKPVDKNERRKNPKGWIIDA